MKKLILTLVCAISFTQVSGCSSPGSINHLTSEMNTFGPTISKVRMLIPKGLDLKIDLTSSGWDNTEALEMNKMTAVQASSLVSKYCYSLISPNDVCESGVQYLEPLPEKRFNTSLSINHYTHLMSNNYNETKGRWYRSAHMTRVSWPFWFRYQTELIELASLAEEYIKLQKSQAYKLGVYKQFKQFALPLEEGNAYTFADLKVLLAKEAKIETITQRINAEYIM
jgi:hypothetical protein